MVIGSESEHNKNKIQTQVELCVISLSALTAT